MRMKNLLRVLPFIVISLFVSYSWYMIFRKEYNAGNKQILGLILCLANGIIYFYKFRIGIAFTGIVLLLATFNGVGFFNVIEFNSFFLKISKLKVITPNIQLKSLLLLIFYFVINGGYLYEWYLEYKASKSTH